MSVPPIAIEVGEPAPLFEAPDQSGERVSSDAFRGKWIVLYFYPKDDTPGCTTEAKGFRDRLGEFEAENAVVVGVSMDTVGKHQRFCEKYELNFTLLADEEGKIVRDYGVFGQKKFMGRTYDGIFRVTFLIDPKGRIDRIWAKVKVAGHADEVLEVIRGH